MCVQKYLLLCYHKNDIFWVLVLVHNVEYRFDKNCINRKLKDEFGKILQDSVCDVPLKVLGPDCNKITLCLELAQMRVSVLMRYLYFIY